MQAGAAGDAGLGQTEGDLGAGHAVDREGDDTRLARVARAVGSPVGIRRYAADAVNRRGDRFLRSLVRRRSVVEVALHGTSRALAVTSHHNGIVASRALPSLWPVPSPSLCDSSRVPSHGSGAPPTPLTIRDEPRCITKPHGPSIAQHRLEVV